MNAERDPREELASVAASLRAYLEWQVDTGASGIPRGKRRPTAAQVEPVVASAPVPPPEPAQAASPAPSRTMASGAPSPSPAPAPPSASPAPSAQEAAAPMPMPSFDVAPPPRVAAVAAAPHVIAAPPSRDRLPVLAAEVASCTKCALAKTRTQTVFARGNPSASLCFVGEAPGADEDAQGLPFVGRAGQLLDKMIQAMGLSPENDVYVCNIIKCRPPENRKPEADEMDTCIPYLHEQLAIVNPKVIVAMGNTAVQALLQTKMGITKVRGSWKLYKGSTLVMPTYHPSYLLRPSAQQADAKKQAWEDLQAVMKELKLPMPARRG